MTDDYYYGDDQDADGGNPVVRAMLRREARAGEKAKRESAELRRELALTRAGVPDDTPLGKMFRRHLRR